jgi:glycosyltransferase involved in cell wall biosynthesis
MNDTDTNARAVEGGPERQTTVLIVAHNCASALRRSLIALGASAPHKDFEVLLVDDGSRQERLDADAEFPEVTVLRLPRRFGKTKARNIGIRTARGRFLLLLDPGVELSPDDVSTLTRRLSAEENLLGVCPLLVDSSGRTASRSGPLPDSNALYASWVRGVNSNGLLPFHPVLSEPVEQFVECPDPRAVLVHARFVRGMNYFDSRYGEFGSDLDLFTQAFRASRPILLMPAVKAAVSSSPAEPDGPADLLRSDRAAGLVAYTAKYYGFTASLKLRFRMLGWALGHFRLELFFQLLSGARIDGSQPG